MEAADRLTESNGPSPGLPRALLDAGDETGVVLSHAIGRRICELATGDVLEIVSHQPAARAHVQAWCRSTGHELVRLVANGDETRFWIRKQTID